MKSRLFHTDAYLIVEQRIVDFLNARQDYLSATTVKSPRAVGDAIQDILSENFKDILADEHTKYSTSFARRVMTGIAFEDAEGFYYVVDVKTHCLNDIGFDTSTITPLKRLIRFYEDDKNYFVLLFISYETAKAQVVVKQAQLVPIEFLGWDCLSLDALGQIQVSHSNIITTKPGYSRKIWMIELCDNVLEFFPKEIEKARTFWDSHPEE